MADTPNIIHTPNFLNPKQAKALQDYLSSKEVKWHIVEYFSNRLQQHCSTPCYTTCMGGLPNEPDYIPMSQPILSLLDAVSKATHGAQYNVVLLRMYFPEHQIAWHTDDREFLGPQTIVASYSLGQTRKFEMRRTTCLWNDIFPTEDYRKRKRAIYSNKQTWTLAHNDFFAMCGDTQKHWEHRVPPMKKCGGVRWNINFRYIRHTKFKREDYEYCVGSDKGQTYDDIFKRRNGTRSINSYFNC